MKIDTYKPNQEFVKYLIMNHDPDLPIIQRCQSGDTSAFDEIVIRHKVRIYQLVYRMLNGSCDVEDVAQEIFIRAFKKIKKFHYKSNFSTWLTRLAVNYCINYIRKSRRLKILPVGLELKNKFASQEVQNRVELSEKMKILNSSIEKLSPKQKAVIILHYFEEYSCQEIAEILDCSAGTVKSRLFNARNKLRKQLEPYMKDINLENARSEVGGKNYEMSKI
ncbi:sigma-70 family RNA polymerase sigma factor [Candidatus Poribacteria bacterium]|nr:sigma-70 family RNA polymerase sigma factor [Candidatus Poribacteria bacterium]